MGGFVQPLAEGLAKGIGKLSGDLAESLDKSGEELVSQEHILKKYPETKVILDAYHTRYLPTVKQLDSKAFEQELNLRMPEVKTRNAQGQRIHPTTGAVLNDSPINHSEIHANSVATAREAFLGKKDSLGVVTAAVLNKKYGQSTSDAFADSLSFLMKEQGASKLKANIRKADIPTANLRGMYEGKTHLERLAEGYVHNTFAQLLSLNHAATFFNGLFGTDTKTFLTSQVKAVTDGLGKSSDHWQSLVDTGVMAESLMREVDLFNKFQSSDRTFKLPNDSIMQILYQTLHQPGFSQMRQQQLLSAGIMGRMTAEQAAMDYHLKGSKIAEWQLKEFGLEPSKIKSQNGRLDPEDVRQAVFQFVDKHYYLDNMVHRSRLLQASPTGRIVGVFHSYLTRQAQMMGKAMFRDLRERGPYSVARNLAIGGILFPVLGEGVKLLNQTVRGQDASGTAKHDISDMMFRHGSAKAIAAYIDALSYVGGIGVYSHLMRGALHHSLLDELAGPAIGSQVELAQDLFTGARRTVKSHGRHIQTNFKPFEKDLGYDTPYISALAALLEHRVAPNKGEHHKNDELVKLYHWIRDKKETQENTEQKGE